MTKQRTKCQDRKVSRIEFLSLELGHHHMKFRSSMLLYILGRAKRGTKMKTKVVMVPHM